MIARYCAAFGKNPDVYHLGLMRWIADDLAATIATQAARIEELEKQVAWKEGLIRQLTDVDMPAMEADNERLRAELAAAQRATLSPTERGIIEAMVEDWSQLYEPGSDEWADAKMIDAWLHGYSGTMYDEMKGGE